MEISRTLIALSAAALISGCTPLPYQRAFEENGVAWDGYLDEQIGPNRYVIEVGQKGGYQMAYNAKETLRVYTEYWHRRAKELCPDGYSGSPDIRQPYKARIERFRCELRYCQEYPLVSGVAECENGT